MSKCKMDLNRRTYKSIKKMDHAEMSGYLNLVYDKGYEAGKKSAEGLSETEVMETILQIKGIGEKKANAIVAALTAAQKEKEGLTDG